MKRNRKWKIPHTVLERWTLWFSSYKNRHYKIKLWWARARERKKEGIFCTFILPKRNFFNISVLSQRTVYWIHFQFRIYILSHIKKHYFIHFCCLFLKFSKVFSESLSGKNSKKCSINLGKKTWLKKNETILFEGLVIP